MSKSESEEDFEQGVEDGKSASTLERITHCIESSEAYEKGYTYGIEHKYDSDSSGGGSESSSGGGGGGGFITTATLTSLGRPDDCEELTTFREYRDHWLINRKDGKQLITEYYSLAPKIVDAINASPNSRDIYKDIWKNDIEPCLVLIKEK